MNTQTDWQPVALIPASLSNDDTTTIEVARTGDSVYIASWNIDGDSKDTRMTTDEALYLIEALAAAVHLPNEGA